MVNKFTQTKPTIQLVTTEAFLVYAVSSQLIFEVAKIQSKHKNSMLDVSLCSHNNV